MEQESDVRKKKAVAALVFAVVTCLGAVTVVAAPAIRLLWVTANLAGCGAVLKRLGAGVQAPQLLPTHEEQGQALLPKEAGPAEPLHDMPRTVSCEIVAVDG